MSRAILVGILALLVLAVSPGLADEAPPLIVHGGMRQVLARGEHQARVGLGELIEREHLYAVGAVEGLRGEITILDSVAYVTGVDPEGGLQSLDVASAPATLLVGQSVAQWVSAPVESDVTPDRLDAMIRGAVEGWGREASAPFLFLVEGELIDARLHVINGVCPVRAREHGLEIADDQRPHERDIDRLRGMVVGVYAPDAAGRITHHGTSVHAHLVFIDEATGERVTGHLERFGLAAGASMKLPGTSE